MKTVPYLIPVIIASSFALLAVQPELRIALPLLTAVTVLVSVMSALFLYLGERGAPRISPGVILGVALVLRIFFLFGPPQLSDDIYRYVWDGGRTLLGENPYASAPAAVHPPPDLAYEHSRINHPAYVTIYPPAAQAIFAIGALPGLGVTGLKALLLLFDMGLCVLIMRTLGRLGMPLQRCALYAWNPLPVLEIAGSGHVDGAGLTMLMGAVCMILAERENFSSPDGRRWVFGLSGALTACAALVKLFPIALLPVLTLLIPSRRRPSYVLGFAAASAALILPFLPHLVNMADTLGVYSRHWEFAGFAFNALRKLTGSGGIARMLLFCGFLTAAALIFFRTARLLKIKPCPGFEGRTVMEAFYATSMAMLLLTPTLQPWYALSLAVFLPFCAGPAGIVLCWAVFLTYQVQIPYFILGQWTEDPRVTAAVFFATVVAYLSSRFSPGRSGAGIAAPDQ